MSDPGTVALRLARLKGLKDRVDRAYNAARAEQATLMPAGGRWPAVAEDGTKLGTVTRTEITRQARIADRNAFGAWARSVYPGDTEYAFEVTGTDREVEEALYEHARHLIKTVTVVSDELRRKILDLSTEVGGPVGPGGEVDVPGVAIDVSGGDVRCRPVNGPAWQLDDLIAEPAALLALLAVPEPDSAGGVA